jgi:hypothetical protein
MCDSLNARAVIVLAFSEDGIAGASYGETKRECGQIGYTMDRIIEAIENEQIPVWATRESEEARSERIVRESVADGSYCAVCKVPWSDCDCDNPGTQYSASEATQESE